MNIQFGSGVLFGVPNAGNTAANPTPFKFGVLQEATVEFKGDLKKLFGQSQFPVAKARGKIEVNCKAKIGTLDPNLLNQLYFGQSQGTGLTAITVDEAGTVPAVSTYVITVAGSATFATDYGVINATTGQQLTKVSSSPATQQYSVNASTGVYTFASADANMTVKISYSSTETGTTKSTITLANQLMGYAPEFRAFLQGNFRTKRFAIELFSCTMGQLSIPTKQEDYWMADITFDAGVDASDVLGKIYADLY